jgi:hypothetical protein
MRLPKNPTLLEIRAKIRSAKFRMKELDKAIDALASFERIQASERTLQPYPTIALAARSLADSATKPRAPLVHDGLVASDSSPVRHGRCIGAP